MATYCVREMREYLLNEHGYTEEEIKRLSVNELYDLYEMFHEY